MNSSSSLRDLYSDQSSTWSFTLPPPDVPGGAAIATNSTQPGPSTPSFQWKSSRAPHNSIFDLSPDLNDISEINLIQIFKTVVASAMLQYSSTAIAMPWEVGKLLLQVQWVPRDVQDTESIHEVPEEEQTSDTDSEDESYFADPGAPTSTRARRAEYQHALYEDSLPEYIIPVGPQDGVWGMMKRIGRFRGEGWLALWKGLLTSCVTEVLSSTLQPIIHNILQSIFVSPTTLYHQPPIFLPVASHLITGLILAPLDLIRTRMIVQSFIPRYRSYSGPIDALNQILRDEGGIKGIYLHPNLLIPAIIDSAFRPLVALALPGIIASYVGRAHITEENNPIAWGIAELAGSCVGLLLTLPFETVRRRLQIQSRGNAKPIQGCVELCPTPYYGVVDALWRIVTEERSDVPAGRQIKKRRLSRSGAKHETIHSKQDEGWFRNTGIGQLYRGLGMRLGASVIVFILALVSGGEDSDSGWAEL
ncbi:mitochondrial carrier domain-containing protein [Lentinula aciculospora]|uniref:Mitochondrial carrier domain-containing protein n=1 Tax=Lentinula aciculospora TaxID=153920 RepID=A0A9W9A845_9AGAR|nr:mitochondrial carrier domain-containing protein [Lentinula aciculospora]